MTFPTIFPSPPTSTTGTVPAAILARQIWAEPTTTSGSLPHSCTPYKLPSGGEINVGHGTIVTLTQDAGFQPVCPGIPVPAPIDPLQPGVDVSVLYSKDPFYSSTNPQIYAIAAVTIVSYMLVIILFITPRTFFIGGAGDGGGFLGQRGMAGRAYGSNSVIGIGSRPWLQKVAALTVCMSMTIVTADTFKWAHRQYDAGYEDATELTDKVITGVEVRVVRTISETFLWLAQAQTLIRLFPRHKEKLMIKWIAFFLISLELTFSILNHFVFEGSPTRPKRFINAIPAMNYLFALTLNLCYGGFIVYYALQKRRFAFYHPHMRNMPLVALLSLTAVMIPVVFFILDLSQPNVAGWGSYVRWVGAAAASVVVWEWVERIEALERDEKKGGILGREIFDGDEMLHATPPSEVSWPTSRRKPDRRRPSGSSSGGASTGWIKMTASARRLRPMRQLHRHTPQSETEAAVNTGEGPRLATVGEPCTSQLPHHAQPLPVSSPISRADTTSDASTVYMVRYHPISEPTPPIREAQPNSQHQEQQRPEQTVEPSPPEAASTESTSKRRILIDNLQKMPNPFRRQRETPPPEVVQALAQQGREPSTIHGETSYHASLLERLHLKKSSKAVEALTAPIVIPAPHRRRRPSADDPDDSMSDDGNMSTNRDYSSVTGDAMSRDPDRPPDAVLNAIQKTRSISPLSDHAHDDPFSSATGVSTLSPMRGVVVPRDFQRPMHSPIVPAEPGNGGMGGHTLQ